MNARDDLANELKGILNAASRENASETPDFILAEYMLSCLEAFETGVRAREEWHGREVKQLEADAIIVESENAGG